METHRDGLFRDSAATEFAAQAMTAALQDFVEVIVGWMRSQYEFDPAAAELEAAVLATLSGEVDYVLQADRLSLDRQTDDGDVGLTLVAS